MKKPAPKYVSTPQQVGGPPCKFNPQGSDIFSCINTCVNNQYCDYKDVFFICKSCKDPDTCMDSRTGGEQDNPYEPVQLVELNGKPYHQKSGLPR